MTFTEIHDAIMAGDIAMLRDREGNGASFYVVGGVPHAYIEQSGHYPFDDLDEFFEVLVDNLNLPHEYTFLGWGTDEFWMMKV